MNEEYIQRQNIDPITENMNQDMEDSQDYLQIYEYCKKVYKGEIKSDIAAEILFKNIPRYNTVSYQLFFIIFQDMMLGKKYSRQMNLGMTKFFLQQIRIDYGVAALERALQATHLNIQYYFEQTGSRQPGRRKLCAKIAKDNGIPIDFSESMYDNLSVKDRTNISHVENSGSEPVRLGWFVGSYIDQQDQLDSFIEQGIWQNGYTNRYLELVRSIKVGDRIAAKASFVQRNNLPFQIHGKAASVMSIRAIGRVTGNSGDGRTIQVDWTKLDVPKQWFFYTNRSTIWKVKQNSENWMSQALLDFTFLNKPQDYTRFLKYSYWREKYFPESAENAQLELIPELELKPFGMEDFLNEVFMTEERYHTICELMKRKKNLILQGAPGVGKTFAAKRLAYAMMGEKDDERIMLIQFHQSYAYEDFIMGYKPDRDGFTLQQGVFYRFCKIAEEDPGRPYFFLIDEINRGNLSKIFGELLMLIENDKRGSENAMRLAYADEYFSVPENLYLIGMMNTADRGLAIIDYALRRRFCFIELEPAFALPAFRTCLKNNGVDEALIEKITVRMMRLNQEISSDPSLGRSFRIGHSYFCSGGTDIQWYENIIRYEIVPMLEEYWMDDNTRAEDWTEELLR